MWANAFWGPTSFGGPCAGDSVAWSNASCRVGGDGSTPLRRTLCTQREEGTSPARRTYEATLLLRRLEAPLDRARRVAQLGQRVGPARGRLQSRGPDEAQREQNLLEEDHGVWKHRGRESPDGGGRFGRCWEAGGEKMKVCECQMMADVEGLFAGEVG